MPKNSSPSSSSTSHGSSATAGWSTAGSSSPGSPPNTPTSPTPPDPALRESADALSAHLESAERSARALNRWAKFWQIADVSLGWSAAVLAAVAGALGLGQIVGREGAAILAPGAAGLIAGNQYLGTGTRFELDRRRRNAYEALACDARLEEAKAKEKRPSDLDDVMRALLQRLVAIKEMDHQSIPAEALGRWECSLTEN